MHLASLTVAESRGDIPEAAPSIAFCGNAERSATSAAALESCCWSTVTVAALRLVRRGVRLVLVLVRSWSVLGVVLVWSWSGLDLVLVLAWSWSGLVPVVLARSFTEPGNAQSSSKKGCDRRAPQHGVNNAFWRHCRCGAWRGGAAARRGARRCTMAP